MQRQFGPSARRGFTLLWATATIFMLVMFMALMIDGGRIRLARADLQAAADASSRAAINTLRSGGTATAAASSAQTVAGQNRVDGRAVVFNSGTDIEYGTWSGTTFTKITNSSLYTNANAIRVTVRCDASHGGAVPSVFGALLGRSTFDVSASAIASLASTGNGSATVPATADLWFSGVTGYISQSYNGESWNNSNADPAQLNGLTITPGQTITISATGSLSNNSSASGLTPDGDTDCVDSAVATNGISNVTVPLNSMVAVFLNDSDPRYTSTPTALDFSTPTSRDYTTISPQLKQAFFVGDGKTSSGVAQQIVVPAGATRLFFGSMDAYGWANNAGSVSVTARVLGNTVLTR
ncbi:MAG: TadG family pilus assembly protein [Tepidisphaeraceae bacterium]